MNRDLTVGSPRRVLLQFSLPLLGSVLFQQLYNIADSLIAGRFIGEDALAAVGNAYEVTLIFIAVAFGCSTGCSVVVSRLFGARRYGDLRTAVSTAFIAAAGLCLALMLPGLLFCSKILRMINTPEMLLADCRLYLSIYMLAFPFQMYYNAANGIFSAMGDSRTPFFFLAFSSLSNIFADILFVTALDLGVAGLALATLLCQAMSCILALTTLKKRLSSLDCTHEPPRLFSFDILRSIARIALPTAAQQSFVSFGNIIIQSVINSHGPAVIAGYAAAIKLNNMIVLNFGQLGTAMSNYTAQNLGAKKTERLRPGFYAGLQIGLVMAVISAVCYQLLPRQLVGLFMDSSEGAALEAGVQFLLIVSPFYPFIVTKHAADGILRGAGLMRQFMISTFADLLLRTGLSVLFSSLFGSVGIWCSWPVGWFIGAVLAVVFYRAYLRRQLTDACTN